MIGLVETPFKLSLEEILCSAAMTIFLNALSKEGCPDLTLEQICFNPQYGFTASASSIPCGPHFVRITDIKEGRIDWNTVPFCECPDPENFQLDTDDILIARAGSIGKSFIVKDISTEAVFASYMIRLRVRQNFNPEYIYWCLQSQQFWAQIMEAQRGSAMKNINAKMISLLKFPVSSLETQSSISTFLSSFLKHLRGSKEPLPVLPHFLEEQRRIVARIEEVAAKIEEARGLRREAVEEVENLCTSYLSRQFDYQNSDHLPPSWKWIYLSDLLINSRDGITTGPFGTLLQRSEIQLDGIPVLGIANVQKNKFIPGFSDYVSIEKAEELATYKVYVNDIVIARSGTVGRSCIIPLALHPNPIMSTNLIRLRLNEEKFLPELLCKLFNGSSLIESYKDAHCYGSTRTFFTQKMLLNLQIPTPPIQEQRQILMNINKLQEQIDLLKHRQAETSAELNALLPSILDKAFKGEL